MKPIFYFFNHEITNFSIQTQTSISLSPHHTCDVILNLKTAEAVAEFRPEGSLHYIWFKSWNCAKLIMEELDMHFKIKFVNEMDLVTWAQEGKDDFDDFIKDSYNKYFHD